MKKSAFTLLELLIVVAIIAILAAILFPVFSRARENARKASCISNLHQIGLGIAMYRGDYDGINPRHRSCPDNADSKCYALAPTVSSGPNETWWAPFDNTKPPEPALPDSAYNTPVKAGFLMPYVKSLQVFHCPSYPQGQVGYAMGYSDIGPMGKNEAVVTNPGALQVWDHAKTPGCADTGAAHVLGTPWNPFPVASDTTHTHYPFRHNGGFVGLREDGAVKFRVPSTLVTNDFDANGTT